MKDGLSFVWTPLKTALFFSLLFVFGRAHAEITTSLINANLKSGGFLIGRISTNETMLVLKKDGNEFARLPVRLRGYLAGLTAGADSAEVSGLRIEGLTESTPILSLFTKYSGGSRGGAVVVPGPCCIAGARRSIQAKNAQGDLGLILETRNGFGLSVDLSRAEVEMELLDTTGLSRRVTQSTTIADLIERRQEFELEMDQTAEIVCAIEYGSRSKSQRAVRAKINDPTTLLSTLSGRGVGTSVVRPVVENGRLLLRAGTEGHTLHLTVDLNTRQARVGQPNSYWDPRGLGSVAAYQVHYSGRDGRETFAGTALCNVFSASDLESAVRAAEISNAYLED